MLSLKPIFAVMLLVLAAGCSQVAPVEDEVHDKMSQITVTVETGRAEQLFQQEFERLIARKGIADPRYQLDIRISSNRGENSMVMTANYSLYDSQSGTTLTANDFSSSASIGGITSIFGEEQATIHARERLSGRLAQKIYNHLILFFTKDLASS